MGGKPILAIFPENSINMKENGLRVEGASLAPSFGSVNECCESDL